MLKRRMSKGCSKSIPLVEPTWHWLLHAPQSVSLKVGFLMIWLSSANAADGLASGGLDLLKPIMRWGVGFWCHRFFSWPEGNAREEEIYLAMFPASPYEWADYARDRGVGASDIASSAFLRWRNQILDAQAYWAHENVGRELFVTSDGRFKKLQELTSFPDASIKTPEEAVAIL